MAKQKRATASVKMTYTDDTDLIAWWNHIPRGSRNAVMKDMMRDYIERNRGGYRPIMPKNIPQPFDPNRFTQVCDDAAWMRAALLDLPGYVERVIHHVVTKTSGNVVRFPLESQVSLTNSKLVGSGSSTEFRITCSTMLSLCRVWSFHQALVR